MISVCDRPLKCAKIPGKKIKQTSPIAIIASIYIRRFASKITVTTIAGMPSFTIKKALTG